MMGNNQVQALDTARSISKQLATNRQHRPKTRTRQNAVNLTGKTANSESAGSDHGVTRHTQLPSAAQASGYLKEITRVDDNTNSDLNDNSYVYHVGKLNTGTREIKPEKSGFEAARDKRTASDQSTKSVDNKKPPVVVVDLTLDESDDDCGDGGGNDADVKVTVGDTGSTGGNISGSREIVVDGVRSGVSVSGGGGDRDGVCCKGNGKDVGMSNGISVGSVGVGSGVSLNGGGGDSDGVCSKGNGKDVGMRNGISVGSVGVNSGVGVTDGGAGSAGVSSGVGVGDRAGVSRNGYDRGVAKSIAGGTGVVCAISGDRVGVGSGNRAGSLSGVGTVGHAATDTTLPKILAAYSLNHSEIRNLLCQKSKDNVVKPNGVVGNGSAAKKLDPTQMVFSWSVRHDSNLDSVRRDQGGAATPTDSEDQVIITKVVTSAEKSLGRKHHPRKAPVEVRKLFLEDKAKEPISSTVSERDALKRRRRINNTNIARREKRSLEETIASLNGTINGTPWSFTMKPDIGYRETKIRDLKNRLAIQEEAVEKLRSKENSVSPRVNGVDRVLVVQIPDLKTKLEIQSEKKQSFRVFDQEDVQSAKSLANKRKRKALPKKDSREAGYDSDGRSYRPQKRTRVGKEKIRQRLPRQSRRRSFSPTIRKTVPVVSKDLWHREMEKMEAELDSSNRAIDKTAFLLFLGLKKVDAM